MWKVQKVTDGDLVVLAVSGHLEGEQLVELRKVLASEGGTRDIVLDLKGVKLVDRDSVRFLSRCEADGVELRNCPAYIREWIVTERAARNSSRDVQPG
jgi:anti-anti-sigma regulatory factor